MDGMQTFLGNVSGPAGRVTSMTFHVEQPPRNTIVEVSLSRFVTYRQCEGYANATTALTRVQFTNPDGSTGELNFPASSGRNVVAKNGVTGIDLTVEVECVLVHWLMNLFYWPSVGLRGE
ncbi:hypothetical protein [Goodfellowiella coeruleoviolacea]|uniref:Uncharacterized protein n=1 Tax=Goodfellowiella coeruleoviolacea TaxID=334858 RepID=A0AAE3KKL5_9PSEU|nr:hypothetical protein [Goodfellowiella coeruleoviolacea]MCP2165548.1 hypothetical protein [Goodfellowiella coeruleoviolacea]